MGLRESVAGFSLPGSCNCGRKSGPVRIDRIIKRSSHDVRRAGRNLQMLSIRPAHAGDVSALNTLIHELAEFERLPVAVTEADLLRDGFGGAPRFRVLDGRMGRTSLRAMRFSLTTIRPSRVAPGSFWKTFTFASDFAGRELERRCWRGWRRSPARKIALACAGRCSTGILPRSSSIESLGANFWMSGKL